MLIQSRKLSEVSQQERHLPRLAEACANFELFALTRDSIGINIQSGLIFPINVSPWV
jgi:LytS/YehU family sensor histidine kinase